jgi:hypothetical protein
LAAETLHAFGEVPLVLLPQQIANLLLLSLPSYMRW